MSTTIGGGPKPHWLEQVIRWAFPVGAVIVGVKFFNSHIAPTVISLFSNLESIFNGIFGAAAAFLAAAVLVIPIILVVSYFMTNPHMLSNLYTTICRGITKFFIKLDPLSYMDSYLERLIQKRKNLQKTRNEIAGKRVELQREVDEVLKSFQENMKNASAAKQLSEKHPKGSEKYEELKQLSAHHASMGKSDEISINKFKPMLEMFQKCETVLNKLEKNFGLSIENMKHDIKRRRREYETMKKMGYAFEQAADFINSDSKEARDFGYAIQSLEETVSQKIAYIEQFEKDSQIIMQTFDLKKQVNTNEGLELLEQFERNAHSIFLPENYADVTANAQVVSSTPLNSEFSSLLKK